MTTSECNTCTARVHEEDRRIGPNNESGCIYCCPSADDEADALSDYQERQVDAYRERDL